MKCVMKGNEALIKYGYAIYNIGTNQGYSV